MIPDVTHFSIEEGKAWITWPFKPHIKPSNPHLALKAFPMLKRNGSTVALWNDKHYGVKIAFHAIKTSDGCEWDTINGWRYGRRPQ